MLGAVAVAVPGRSGAEAAAGPLALARGPVSGRELGHGAAVGQTEGCRQRTGVLAEQSLGEIGRQPLAVRRLDQFLPAQQHQTGGPEPAPKHVHALREFPHHLRLHFLNPADA